MKFREQIMNYNRVTIPETGGETEALVVFSGRADLPWLRCLRAGFRHCFVALRDGPRWVIYEPLSHRTVISVADTAEGFDLAGWFELFGHAVVPARVEAGPPRPAPRSEEHTSELQSLMRISYAVFCLKTTTT